MRRSSTAGAAGTTAAVGTTAAHGTADTPDTAGPPVTSPTAAVRTGSGTPRPDVAVVGGGVIGLVTAWRAAQRGLRTTVVDPEPGGGAARVAAGMLAAVTELHYGEEALLALNLASSARYPGFAAELEDASGQEIGYRPCGTLAVALDADDRAHLRELHALQRRCGLDSQWLTGRECRRLEPMLSPSVRGGLRVDGDHQADPRRLATALLLACEHAGVTFRRASAVRLSVTGAGAEGPGAAGPVTGRAGARAARARTAGARTAGARAAGVVLDDGTAVEAGQTVLATGSWASRMAGVPRELLPPVRPVKGQVLRLRMPPASGPHGPFLSRTVRAIVRGGHLYLVPRANGELVIGATSEEMGWDTTVTAGGVYELLRDAHELTPGVTELPLTETSAGLRPASPDNAPLLGPTALADLHLATGHHRNGVLLTPVTGDAMGELLAGGELPEPVRPFTPGRFEGAAAPATARALSLSE
ncbi:glycine oxidase ThiO [Streptomyces sp. HNM0575]|uniref:glycine oxidase ThiO n=1 Tax=Streptomyces sp. HNM0575 TaxID=2716338 RepID=UPI00145D9FF9|nr:glycine oxidase ThiO [Streptomyces sp. HNM0575]NLU74549.1 glycine oxidase ThiO [Streptomyces sp. HNM0575]